MQTGVAGDNTRQLQRFNINNIPRVVASSCYDLQDKARDRKGSDGARGEGVHDTTKIVMTVLRLSQVFSYQLEALLEPFGVRLTDLRLMILISEAKGSPQKVLARNMGVSQVVVSTRLDKLERMGLVCRQQVQGRLVSVDLTRRGRALLAILMRLVEESVPAQAFANIASGEQENLTGSLSQWEDGMHRLQPPTETGLLRVPYASDQIPALKRRLEEVRKSLEAELQARNYQIDDAVAALTAEMDTLVQAYMAVFRTRGKRHGS